MTLDRRTLILGGAAVATLGTSEAAAPEPLHTAMIDKQQRVLGIGGLFFRSRRFARLHDPDGNPIELGEPAGRGSQ
jgi:hypothetical protein